MKIAFITPTLQMGGYEKVIIGYANELAKRKHEVIILCGFKKGELLNCLEKNIKVYDFKSRQRNFIFPLIKFLKKNKDINILYSGFRYYNCISVIAKFFVNSKVKIYATQHGFEDQNKILEFILGKIINKADYNIAVAKKIGEFEKRKLHIKDDFKILYNPIINGNEIIKKEYFKWFSENVPIVIMSCRIEEDKNVQLGIKIFNELQKKIDCRMMILGNGSKLLECKNLVNKYNLGEKVKFMGFVNNPKGFEISADVFLHTARIEGFGNTIVDALYSNCPIVTTNTTGPIEIIENDKYGINIGNYNDDNVIENGVEAIVNILNGKIKFKNLEKRALDFNIEKTTDKFLEVYNEKKG